MEDSIEDVVNRIRKNWPEAQAQQAGRVIALVRQVRLLQDAAQKALTDFDLSRTEFEVLAALRSHPAPHRLTPTDLYDAMLMSSGGLTKVLKALEARRLVSRPDGAGDKRSKPVQLTASGATLVEAAMPVVQAAEVSLLDGPGAS